MNKTPVLINSVGLIHNSTRSYVEGFYGEFYTIYVNGQDSLSDYCYVEESYRGSTLLAVSFQSTDLFLGNFQDYFVDYLHPTVEEWMAFCLEHNIDY